MRGGGGGVFKTYLGSLGFSVSTLWRSSEPKKAAGLGAGKDAQLQEQLFDLLESNILNPAMNEIACKPIDFDKSIPVCGECA